MILGVPMRDPEAEVATTSDQVERALDLATEAAAEAQLAWRRLQDALQENTDLERAVRKFEIALVEARYRWSVFHGANADAQLAA